MQAGDHAAEPAPSGGDTLSAPPGGVAAGGAGFPAYPTSQTTGDTASTPPPPDPAHPDRFWPLRCLLERPGVATGPGFEPAAEFLPFLRTSARVLVVGAGGLGCELLKDLALTGFGNLDVIDMDTIDVSNLNRQFLFRMEDVGRPKSVVAAARVAERVAGVTVTPHVGRIEDKPLEWYSDFHIIVLGLDSLEARRFMNAVACSFLSYTPDGTPDLATVKPIIDGGTEGFKGHARVILPGVTPCFECTLWLFPPQVTFPLCTLAETPRSPAHCVEWAHLLEWGRARPGEEFDADNEEHMAWVHDQALRRAAQHGIEGVTPAFTAGVVKNIVPAIASTNAIIAAACALEAFKIATLAAPGLDNYLLYMGGEGTYSLTSKYEADPGCPLCSAGVEVGAGPGDSLQAFLEGVAGTPALTERAKGGSLAGPSVSLDGVPLYARGAFEADTAANLDKTLTELGVSNGTILVVNDRSLPAPQRVRVKFHAGGDTPMAGAD